MTEAALKAKVVRVRQEIGEGGWFYATSPDLKGLLVTEPSLDALDKAIPQAITDLCAAKEVDVIVARAEESADGLRTWVAIPTSLKLSPLKPSRA